MQSLKYPLTNNTIALLADPISYYENSFNEPLETESSPGKSLQDPLNPNALDSIYNVIEFQPIDETLTETRSDNIPFDLGHFFKEHRFGCVDY